MANIGVYGAPLEALEGDTAVTLTTAASYSALKPGWKELKMYCASEWRMALSPKLLHALYYTAATTTYVDYVSQATDADIATHMPLDAMLATDIVYLCFNEPVLGCYFTIDGTNKNDNAAVLDVDYVSVASVAGALPTFANVTGDADGTDVGGDTLKQSGVYTWTLPTWVRSPLVAPYGMGYWLRIMTDATLSATVDIQSIIPVYQNTNYGWMEPGIEYQFAINPAKVGGFVHLATAGTPALHISRVKH